MRAQPGDWMKVTGGDHGAVYTRKGWIAFQCLMCASDQGWLYGRRLSLNDSATGRATAYCQRPAAGVLQCGGAPGHNRILEERSHK
jgi:hypothetical protein